MYAVHYMISIIYPPAKDNEQISYWARMCVIALFLLGYLLYSWKSNMSEFLKRLLLAVPFALMLSIFIKIMRFPSRVIIVVGLLTYILLLFKTPNWKQHFSAILIPASIFIIVSKFVLSPLPDLDKPMSSALLRAIFSIACIMPILCFFSLYMYKLVYTDTLNLRVILIRAVKSSIAVILFCAIFFILNAICDQLGISFLIQFMAYSVLTIFFLVIVHIFDLSLIEREKKKNRISELQKELNDSYLEERAKTKRGN